ncbi:MAG: NUDIX domain-containing protein [Campylobacterota bacterium]|nr:NUDIX domain-containing protein [Campylobacterota bacterium]
MEHKIKAYGICLYKIEPSCVKILLCKSVKSQNRWGFLKGVQDENESKKQTAIREFFEESGIEVEYKYLENYFEQINETKDIGIFLANYENVKKIDHHFINEKLLDHYLCWENSEVKFFDINNIKDIKKKQKNIVKEIIEHFKKGK